MWHIYDVTWKFKEKLCGSVPQSRELIRPWLEARAPKVKPVDAIPLDELEEEVANSIQETEERVTLGFQHDESGLYVRAGTIRAHIKDCSNQINTYLGVSTNHFIPRRQHTPIHPTTPLGVTPSRLTTEQSSARHNSASAHSKSHQPSASAHFPPALR